MGYLETYKTNNSKYRLKNENTVTNKLIYGSNGNKYWIDNLRGKLSYQRDRIENIFALLYRVDKYKKKGFGLDFDFLLLLIKTWNQVLKNNKFKYSDLKKDIMSKERGGDPYEKWFNSLSSDIKNVSLEKLLEG